MLDQVRRADVQDFHENIEESGGPYEANRVINLIGKMFSLAERWGDLPEGHPNLARLVEKCKGKKRIRWIKAEEMPSFLESIALEDEIVIRAGLILYLVTGLRNKELMRVKWADIDVENRLLRISENKAGRPFFLPLSHLAIQVFQKIPPLLGCPYVFPGPDGKTHLREFPRKPWYRIRERAGLPDVRIHDLRRTFGSWLTTHGHSLAVVARSLTQSTLSTTEIYSHLADGPLRKAVEDHAGNLLQIQEGAALLAILPVDAEKQSRK